MFNGTLSSSKDGDIYIIVLTPTLLSTVQKISPEKMNGKLFNSERNEQENQ